MKALLFAALVALLHFAPPFAAYEPPRPSAAVEIVRYDWHDAARDRDVPVKIYFPQGAKGPLPIIIFSHGLGGSREGYEYLGQHWAGCGFVSVHLQHLGSDDSVWKNASGPERMEALRKATMSLANTANRPKDVSFAIDQLTLLNSDAKSPLRGRLDLKNIGMSGHSYGGFTTMAIAGQELGPANWADSRVKAAIQMSAPVARPATRAHAYANITMPVFHMTGTRDDSPIGETKAEERRIPFDAMNSAETCLLTFKDGDHMAFAGAVRRPGGPNALDADFQKLICASSTAFWDAWLRGNTDAHAWLMDGGFATQLGAAGVFEKKTPAK